MGATRSFSRRLSTLIAAVSLVLFVLVTVRWLREPPRKYFHMYLAPVGQFEVRGIVFEDGLVDDNSFHRIPTVDRHREFADFHYVAKGNRYSMVAVPYWFALLLFGPAPALWLVGAVRRSCRAASGRCLDCGYDLRAHAGGERCPECGAVASVIPKSP